MNAVLWAGVLLIGGLGSVTRFLVDKAVARRAARSFPLGTFTVNITGAKLSADGKTVSLTIEDVRPVMQQAIKWDLKAQDGTPVAQETQHTIHVVPGVASVN